MKPVFTIGIAFKDPGRHFSLAIQSVFAQTFSDWELVLVDDGSTDGSVEFARSLNDPRVSVYCDGQRKNLNVRLNQMVRLATGRFFVRMDADDVMHPERLMRQYEILTAGDENTVVGTGAYSIDSDSQVIGMRAVPVAQMTGFQARHSFDHPTVAGPLTWFQSNPYSEQVIYHRAEDAELWCRTSGKSRFIVLKEPLLFYREGGAFSYAGYLGTTMGILYLLKERHPRPIHRYLLRAATEISKLAFCCFCDGLGKSDWIIKRRYRPLAESVRRQAEVVLEQVKKQSLPIST